MPTRFARRALSCWCALALSAALGGCPQLFEDDDAESVPDSFGGGFVPPSADAATGSGGVRCSSGGVDWPVGARVLAEDGCNWCTCQASGELLCTETACGGGNLGLCGSLTGALCPAGTFCEDTLGGDCSAPPRLGQCVEKPAVCGKNYQPVCGCDGLTYGSACTARSVGVAIAYEGACSDGDAGPDDAGAPPEPGGDAGQPVACRADADCAAIPCACLDANGDGLCENECPVQVCRGYRCVDPSAETLCGGLAGLPCGTFEFCNVAGHCGAGDQSGLCEVEPQVCDAVYAPVCGCDGQTYANECGAHAARVSVRSDGACN